MSVTTTSEELAEQVDRVGKKIMEPVVLLNARAALTEVGIIASRRNLEAALSVFEASQAQKRRCEAEERNAQEAYDQAVSEAEWTLDGFFELRSNKSWLVRNAEGPLDEGDQRPLDAAQRKEWKANEARKLPAVAKAAGVLRTAADATAESRDQVVLAERRFSACKADLDAAKAQLNILALAIQPVKE